MNGPRHQIFPCSAFALDQDREVALSGFEDPSLELGGTVANKILKLGDGFFAALHQLVPALLTAPISP